MCHKCQELTEVIDELSELLARAQRNRRRAFQEARIYRHLLVMDMEKDFEEQIQSGLCIE